MWFDAQRALAEIEGGAVAKPVNLRRLPRPNSQNSQDSQRPVDETEIQPAPAAPRVVEVARVAARPARNGESVEAANIDAAVARAESIKDELRAARSPNEVGAAYARNARDIEAMRAAEEPLESVLAVHIDNLKTYKLNRMSGPSNKRKGEKA